MKKVIFVLLFLAAFIAQAQSPQLNVKGQDSVKVKMSQMIVNVDIIGNIAYTTTEMHFVNSGSRDMEGELLFPLPEGVSVSRYAIDINGKMREAVPVNKSKGKQVFEAIQHKRVDPGLLEKVDGNNFRTRIYPISPNKERVVLIGFEQELSGYDQNNLAYQLVSKYPFALDKFEININVSAGDAKPLIINEGKKTFSKDKILEVPGEKTYRTSYKMSSYKPSEKLLIKIPIQSEIPNAYVQSVDGQYYFYATTVVEGNKLKKKNPASIGLIWDNSLSCKNRDSEKEFEVLDAYFKEIKNTAVTLYLLNYSFEKEKEYTVVNGDWSALKSALKNVKYDGGTRFSKLNFSEQDEYLFFTDGLSSLSESTIQKTKKPVYTISSLVSSDFSFLKYAAMQSGGSFINLNQLNAEKALDKLLYQNLKFLGIKENYSVVETYPMAGTSVSGNFSVSGISLKSKNEIVLLFGYSDKPVLEKKIVINAEGNSNSQQTNIERIWAQKKLADLEIQPKKNAVEIELLGKRYGLVTGNTSLIVLESLNDYILYDIMPPQELSEQYDVLMKQRGETAQTAKISNWKNIDMYYDKLTNWWSKDVKYATPKVASTTSSATSKKGKGSRIKGRKVAVTAPNRNVRGDKDAEIIIDQPTGEGEKAVEVIEEDRSPNLVQSLAGKVSGLQVETANATRTSNAVADTLSSGRIINRDLSQIKTKSWNPDRVYLKALDAAPKEKKYELYLELREEQLNNPSFYFDVANYFYNAGDKQKGILILSNIADLSLENHQLYKSLIYQLRQWGAYEDALFVAQKVAKWREHEPQSYRDLALTLEDNKRYQEAFDTLVKALDCSYYEEMRGHYEGIEDIILMDINRMLAEHKEVKNKDLESKYGTKMPVDLRIILNWNQMDTDIDLHVIEPTGEECYYSKKTTEAGARFSKDFTRGYGPEQYLLRNSVKGKYLIKTNFYGETALTERGPATVMVEIYITDKKGKTERRLQTIQLGKVKQKENLAEIILD